MNGIGGETESGVGLAKAKHVAPADGERIFYELLGGPELPEPTERS